MGGRYIQKRRVLDLPTQIKTKEFRFEVAKLLTASLALVLIAVVVQRLTSHVGILVLIYITAIALLSRVLGAVSATLVIIVAVLCLLYVIPPAYSFRVSNPVDVVAVIFFLITGLVITGLVSTLRKMREEALSSVNRALVDAEERERARIARDLHDDIGQRMALLANKIEQVKSDVSDSAALAFARINELLNGVKELSTDIQTLAHSLHSPKLEYLGLAKTVRSFCREFAQQHQVEVNFTSDDLASPPPLDVSLCLFRVLQEALSNSLKHSGARQFEVELFEESNAAHLIVRDAGVGFNADEAMLGKGLGLISMKERLKLVNGEISFHSKINQGTTVHAIVHLNPERVLRAAA